MQQEGEEEAKGRRGEGNRQREPGGGGAGAAVGQARQTLALQRRGDSIEEEARQCRVERGLSCTMTPPNFRR